MHRNEPRVYQLALFTVPGTAALLNAVLQQAGRRNNVAIDMLQWEITPLLVEDEAHCGSPATDAIIVGGFRLEGAGWDLKGAHLIDPRPLELTRSMPPMQFRPFESKRRTTAKGIYVCPVYYSSVRSGNGEHPSFVVAVDLKSGDHEPEYWIKKGTALLLDYT